MSTHDTIPDIEERLRAALTARADLVQPEDLAPLAPVVVLRPRWHSPWVLIATAAVVLLVLGVVVQGLGRDQRSDDVAPKPDERIELELPPDIGRDWEPNTLSRPPRLDLDGDGTKEEVTFLAEPTEKFDGRFRMQTTLSTTGEEAYGIAEVGTTIDINVLDPIDADDDGDLELVLYYDDPAAGPGGGGYPLVFDLHDGLLVRAVVEDPELMVRGHVPVPGEETEHYDMVRVHEYGVEDGILWSSRTVNAFATGSMTLFRPERTVVDTWEWVLDEDGVLRPEETGCRMQTVEAMTDCAPGQVDDPPIVSPAATETVGIGEEVAFDEGYAFTARIDAVADPSLVVEGGGLAVNIGLEVADPEILTTQPTALFHDGASVVVTSGSDPTYLQVLVQDGARMQALQPVGEIELSTDGGVRTWLTLNGALVTVVAAEDGTWRAWQWVRVSRTEMAAFPTGTVCFDDVDDPATARPC
jgi:hypothetical protein